MHYCKYNSFTHDFIAVAPSITVAPVSTVQLLAPASLSLTCTADGLPLPTITWVKTLSDGSERGYNMSSTDVGDGRSFIVINSSSATTMMSVFVIDSTVVLDTANYSCRASNALGTTDSSFSSVFVYGES